MTTAESGALNEDVAALVEAFEARGLPSWSALSVDAARTLEDDLFGGDHDPVTGDADRHHEVATGMVTVQNLAIDGPGGDLPIRVYRPADPHIHDDADPDSDADADPDAERPGVLVFLHGGLFVLGTLDSADDICRELAARTGCVVCSVDYRLAPEDPFPAAVEDAHAAVEWTREHADAFGADPAHVGVVGSSAGGGLAAATAMRAAHADQPLAVQVLCYPMLSAATITGQDPSDAAGDRFPSYTEHADGPLLTAADVAWGWRHYLRSDVDAHHPFAAPIEAPDALLADTAPAVVATAGVDVLRDEGATYATRLADVGVDVTHAHYPTLAHGFCSMTTSVQLADDAMAEIADAIRAQMP